MILWHESRFDVSSNQNLVYYINEEVIWLFYYGYMESFQLIFSKPLDAIIM